ncbi:hypothetical protein [Desulfarculus baarsii]|uniref:hypothetical protein n=1 Tax=Desulfarculus baarsii TaxID=453230 RepID=UPI0011D16761|nr:hypothetical protein [Desulfarculus baarsii]
MKRLPKKCVDDPPWLGAGALVALRQPHETTSSSPLARTKNHGAAASRSSPVARKQTRRMI